VAGGVIIAGAFGVALAELLKLPRGSVWLVVALTAIAATAIRALTARRR
jgi:hypothetical protein